ALMIQPLENRFVRPAPMPVSVDAIIVLGGSTLARVSTARGVAELNEAGDRLTDAAVLARLYPAARIVYSGGVGMMDPGGEAEAKTAQRFFQAMGIAPDRLVMPRANRERLPAMRSLRHSACAGQTKGGQTEWLPSRPPISVGMAGDIVGEFDAQGRTDLLCGMFTRGATVVRRTNTTSHPSHLLQQKFG
ncbi:MAG: YdcF family protein, partial [Verrucomicrobiaceae bacterium]